MSNFTLAYSVTIKRSLSRKKSLARLKPEKEPEGKKSKLIAEEVSEEGNVCPGFSNFKSHSSIFLTEFYRIYTEYYF